MKKINISSNSLKKSMIFFYFMFLFVLLYYIFMNKFISGNYDAADRFFYYLFAIDPTASRFEPLYVFIGNLLTVFNSPELSLNILASLVFVFAYFSLLKYINNLYWFTVSFIVVFMAVFVIFSIIQIRSGLALWIVVLLFSYILDKKNKVAYVLILFTPLIHSSVLLFVITVYVLYVFRIKIIYVQIALFIGLLTILSNMSLFLNLFLSNESATYYSQYFNGLTTDVYKSTFVLSYLFVSSILILFRKNIIVKNYEIMWVGTNLVIVAIITNLDILIKFAAPFMLLSWIVFFKLLIATKDKDTKFFLMSFSLLVILGSFYFFMVRY